MVDLVISIDLSHGFAFVCSLLFRYFIFCKILSHLIYHPQLRSLLILFLNFTELSSSASESLGFHLYIVYIIPTLVK